MRIFESTSTNTVGSWKNPLVYAPASSRWPPVASRAPSSIPIFTYFITVWSWLSLFDGPISVSSFSPSPTTSDFARATNSSTKALYTFLWTTTRLAADQRWNDLPGRDRHREVPGRDDRAHAERLAHRHRKLVAQLRWHGLAEHPPPFPGDVEGHVDGFLDVAPRLVQDLAHLARHVSRKGLFAVDEDLRRAEEDLRTHGG